MTRHLDSDWIVGGRGTGGGEGGVPYVASENCRGLSIYNSSIDNIILIRGCAIIYDQIVFLPLAPALSFPRPLAHLAPQSRRRDQHFRDVPWTPGALTLQDNRSAMIWSCLREMDSGAG